MHDTDSPHDESEHQESAQSAWVEQEQIELRSVGVDIGSSTSHLTFSRLVLRRMGIHLSSRYVVVLREVIHQSPVILTPYLDPLTIDAERLRQFIHDSYAQAGVTPIEVDTGAVIVTGEAARKENAEAILGIFAEEAGRFVCAVAGPHLETVMAAHGSGALELSKQGPPVLNVDIGGGTTKLAICVDGEIVDTAIINIGGRLIARNGDRIERLEATGSVIGSAVGSVLRLNGPINNEICESIAEQMADCLFEVIDRGELSALTRNLMHSQPLSSEVPVTTFVFSGGVSEFLYQRTEQEFGDLGFELGKSIRKRLDARSTEFTFLPGAEGIRATVIGAAQYTVQVSGSTIFCPEPDVLPMRNVPVLRLNIPDPINSLAIQNMLREEIKIHDIDSDSGPIAITINWHFGPSYKNIKTLGEGLMKVLQNRNEPTVLAFDRDIAGMVGRLLRDELNLTSGLVAVDEVELSSLDYIDIGRPLPPTGVIPLVVKSLVFRPKQGLDS